MLTSIIVSSCIIMYLSNWSLFIYVFLLFFLQYSLFYLAVHGTGIISDYKRCTMTCIIIIIVILALGFIVLFAFIIRKCSERTLALRTRIQSFIVSEPGSITLERADDFEPEVINLDEEGDPILLDVTKTEDLQIEENDYLKTTECINMSSEDRETTNKEDFVDTDEKQVHEKKGAIDWDTRNHNIREHSPLELSLKLTIHCILILINDI